MPAKVERVWERNENERFSADAANICDVPLLHHPERVNGKVLRLPPSPIQQQQRCTKHSRAAQYATELWLGSGEEGDRLAPMETSSNLRRRRTAPSNGHTERNQSYPQARSASPSWRRWPWPCNVEVSLIEIQQHLCLRAAAAAYFKPGAPRLSEGCKAQAGKEAMGSHTGTWRGCTTLSNGVLRRADDEARGGEGGCELGAKRSKVACASDGANLEAQATSKTWPVNFPTAAETRPTELKEELKKIQDTPEMAPNISIPTKKAEGVLR